MMKTLALLAIVLTTNINIQAQVWLEQYLILGVEEIPEEITIEEIYAPLAPLANNKA